MDALCGVNFIVYFLDGTRFRVKTEPGMVIKPDQVLTVEDKGMPFHKNPFRFGNLFIMFKIKFPEKILPNQKAAMTKAVETLQYVEGLDKKDDSNQNKDVAEAETVFLKQYDKLQRNTNPFGGLEEPTDEQIDQLLNQHKTSKPSSQCANQ